MMPHKIHEEDEISEPPRPSYQNESYLAPILTAVTAGGAFFLPTPMVIRALLAVFLLLVTAAGTYHVVSRDRAAKRQQLAVAQRFGVLTVVPKPVHLPTSPSPRRQRGRVVTRNMILDGDLLTTALEVGPVPRTEKQCDEMVTFAEQIIHLAGVNTATFTVEGNNLSLYLQLLGGDIPRAEAIVKRLPGCFYAPSDRQDELVKGIGRVRSDWDTITYFDMHATVLEYVTNPCSLRTAVFAFAGIGRLTELRPVLRLVNLLDAPGWQVFGVTEATTVEAVYNRREAAQLILARYGKTWRPVCGRPDVVASILDPVRRAT
jgi:hypothetical protein